MQRIWPQRSEIPYSNLMTDAPDFATLARQYLDLWEDQLAAMASDSALAEQSARFFEVMARSDAAANPLATAQMAMLAQQFMTLAGLSAGGRPEHDTTARPASPAGSTSAAAASGDSVQQLAELASRLAAIEERLDRLEAGGEKPRRRAQPAAGGRGKKTTKTEPKRKRTKPAKR